MIIPNESRSSVSGQEQSTGHKTRCCSDCSKEFEAAWTLIGDHRFILEHRCLNCDKAFQKANRIEENRKRDCEFELLWKDLCDSEFRLTTESGGKTDLERLRSIAGNQLDRVLNWEYGPRGLILTGNTGTCKTRSLWRLFHKLISEWHGAGKLNYARMSDGWKPIVVMTVGEFSRKYRTAARKFEEEDWFNRLARARIFALDDLGKVKLSENAEGQLFDLIDLRTRKNRPVFITTNHIGNSLTATLSTERGEPLVRRLRDYCDCVAFEIKNT